MNLIRQRKVKALNQGSQTLGEQLETESSACRDSCPGFPVPSPWEWGRCGWAWPELAWSGAVFPSSIFPTELVLLQTDSRAQCRRWRTHRTACYGQTSRKQQASGELAVLPEAQSYWIGSGHCPREMQWRHWGITLVRPKTERPTADPAGLMWWQQYTAFRAFEILLYQGPINLSPPRRAVGDPRSRAHRADTATWACDRGTTFCPRLVGSMGCAIITRMFSVSLLRREEETETLRFDLIFSQREFYVWKETERFWFLHVGAQLRGTAPADDGRSAATAAQSCGSPKPRCLRAAFYLQPKLQVLKIASVKPADWHYNQTTRGQREQSG